MSIEIPRITIPASVGVNTSSQDALFIDTLEGCLFGEFTFFFQGLVSTTDTKVMLEASEYCKRIENPSVRLQFLQEISSNLLSANKSFEVHFDRVPTHLPIPFSLCLLPIVKSTVTVSSPELAILLTRAFQPNLPFKERYDALLEKLFQTIVRLSDAKHTIVICQENTQYSANFTTAEIVLLFFPEAFKKIEPKHIWYLTICNALTSYHTFSIKDRRYDQEQVTETSLIDSLIVSDTMVGILNSIPQQKRDMQCVAWRVALLIHEGMLALEAVPQEPILRSIIKVTTTLLQRLPNETKAFKMLSGTVYDTMHLLQTKKPPQPKDYSYYLKHRSDLASIYSASFLVKDLFVQSDRNWKERRMSTQYSSETLLAKCLLQFLENEPQGLHLIVTNQSNLWNSADSLLNATFIEGMIDAWHQLAQSVDKADLCSRFINMCVLAVTQKLRHHYPLSARNFSKACLGLLPLMDAEMLYKDERFLRVMLSGLETCINQHVTDLPVYMYDSFIYETVRGQILSAIKAVDGWVKTDLFTDVLKTLQALCERRAKAEEFRETLSYFTAPIPRSEELDKRNALFAEMLFRGHLAAIRPRSRLLTTAHTKLVRFSTEQFHICLTDEQLHEFITHFQQNTNTHNWCFLSVNVAKQSALLKKVCPSITSLIYCDNEPLPKELTDLMGPKKIIHLPHDSKGMCQMSNLPREFFPL